MTDSHRPARIRSVLITAAVALWGACGAPGADPGTPFIGSNPGVSVLEFPGPGSTPTAPTGVPVGPAPNVSPAPTIGRGGIQTTPSLFGTSGGGGGFTLGKDCSDLLAKWEMYNGATSCSGPPDVNALTTEGNANPLTCGFPDSYVAAAVLYCWGAKCESDPQKAASFEANAINQLASKDALCSCAPIIGCTPPMVCKSECYRPCPACPGVPAQTPSCP